MQEIRKINDFYEMIEHDRVLVIFYADWSGPANILLQVTEDLKEELKNYKSEVEQIVDGMLEDMQQTINENIKDINEIVGSVKPW